jgi:hypothetical protein
LALGLVANSDLESYFKTGLAHLLLCFNLNKVVVSSGYLGRSRSIVGLGKKNKSNWD